MSALKGLLEECEALLRADQVSLVTKKLSRLAASRVPDSLRLRFAVVSRRAGLTSLGLKLLLPLFADSEQAGGSASAVETTEYAALLIRAGARTEALHRLKALGAEAPVQAELLRARLSLEAWDFESARLILARLLTKDLESAELLKARLHHASALLGLDRKREARESLSETLELSADHRPMRAQAHALRAQLSLRLRDLRAARTDLDVASELHRSPLISKVQAWLTAFETGSVEPIRTFRSDALSRNDAENAREADLIALGLQFQRPDFEYLMFGSPSPHFRERAILELRTEILRDDYILGSEAAPCFDVRTGEIHGSTAGTPPRQVHQTLEILSRDFYQSARIGLLFGELFPKESFDVGTSPHRVHQILLRTRQWLRENGLPVEVVSTNGTYSLKLTGPFAFRVSLERRPVEKNLALLENLRSAFDPSLVRADTLFDGFTAREARGVLGLSSTGFKRFAAWALEAGHLARHGASSATFYRFHEETTAAKRAG